MQKHFYFKHLSRFFAFLFVGIISIIATFSLSATTITSFPPSDFWAVDQTTPQYSYATYPQDTTIGYYHKGDNQCQLTDTVPYTTVAIWNKNQIDLNQNWQFDLRLFFGTGMEWWNQSDSIGSHKRNIADGMAFVLHKFDATTARNMIGNTTWYMGYGYTTTPKSTPSQSSGSKQNNNNQKHNNEFQANSQISPSFAIEFDTEYGEINIPDADFNEGGDSIGCHIAYLKDGNMTALPSTYQPMQNNWANVGVGDWFDVRIVWRKGYENGSAYYDLLTYMQEGPFTSGGPLLLRDSMRFNSLSEIIAGLEVDENCQALVRWGITSATCSIPNRHMVQFIELETTKALPSPALTAVITGSCDKIYNGPSGIISPQSLSDDNSKETRDTIFLFADMTDCYSVGSGQSPNNTIEYTISCKDSLSGYSCNYSFELNGMPAGSECKYYINGMLIDSIIHDAKVSDNSWLFPLDRQYFISDSAVNVKIIIDGIGYNLKIFAEDNTIDLAEQFAQLPNIQLDTDLCGATLMLYENTLVQSIQLPNLPGCSYNLGEYYSHAPFTTYPNIDDNNILTFELDSHACRAEFDIKTQCECDGNFTFRIENPGCVEYACEEIFFDGHANSSHNDTTAGEAPRMPTTTGAPRFFNHSITAGSVLGSNITTITVDEISTTNSMTDSVTKISHHEVYDVSVSFPQGWSSKIVSYKICVTLDNGVTCCDTFECVIPGTLDVARSCNEIDIIMNSDKREALYILDPGLINTPPVPPLYIALYNEWGYLHRVLHNNIPVSSEGTIYYGDLPARLYNIVFWWGEYIKTIPILGSGVGTGGETNINPNE